MNETVNQLSIGWDRILGYIEQYGLPLLMAIVVLFVGIKLINSFVKLLNKRFEKRNLDETLRPFITSLVNWSLKIMLMISVASMIGIATTSFIAVLGAAGLAVGLALQGSLQNFAGGVLILIFKPYKVGDFIKGQGHLGVVKQVQIFNTILTDPQNRTIILPNGNMANSDVTNFTTEGTLRCDMVFGISYTSNIQTAKNVFQKLINEDDRILKNPAPFIGVLELADSSVNITVRPWVKTADNWSVFFDFTEKAKTELEAAGISIPFPQMDVHMIKE
ncbi:MAG: mechanosensitive ion channel [Bacteroidales bacterium]|nr:mechanosensitive ion channel [Bacteroidales bacterium]